MEPLRQVIYIEDDADAMLLAQQIAEDFGIDLICCSDGRTGRLAIEANPTAGVVTDHDLPDASGADLVDVYPDRDIVVFTGHDIPGTFSKPTEPNAFEAALELLIDIAAPIVVPDDEALERISSRFPGGSDRLNMFLGRVADARGRVADELRSGDADRIVRICHEFSPSIGIVGYVGLAATLRRMEVATRDGMDTAPAARLLASRIEALPLPAVAVA